MIRKCALPRAGTLRSIIQSAPLMIAAVSAVLILPAVPSWGAELAHSEANYETLPDEEKSDSRYAYELQSDQVLKWIPPAHTGGRPDDPTPDGNGRVYQQEGTNVRLRMQSFGGEPDKLYFVVWQLLRAWPCELTGDASVWLMPIPGDFVLRKGSTRALDFLRKKNNVTEREQLLAAIDRILREEMKLKVSLHKVEQETEVWVIDGTFKPAPIGDAWRLPKEKHRSYVIYGKTGPGDDANHMTNAGTFDELLKEFGSRTGRPVVNSVSKRPEGYFGWKTYLDEPEKTVWNEFPRHLSRNVDLVARHFQEQTGLRFRKVRRKVRLFKASIESSKQ